MFTPGIDSEMKACTFTMFSVWSLVRVLWSFGEDVVGQLQKGILCGRFLSSAGVGGIALDAGQEDQERRGRGAARATVGAHRVGVGAERDEVMREVAGHGDGYEKLEEEYLRECAEHE
ncbi:MAG: hypothetical protein OXO53_11500, partial [Chloroflexota bacterium]|nr:hypothetical protein [Chloroflexota bacterium]